VQNKIYDNEGIHRGILVLKGQIGGKNYKRMETNQSSYKTLNCIFLLGNKQNRKKKRENVKVETAGIRDLVQPLPQEAAIMSCLAVTRGLPD